MSFKIVIAAVTAATFSLAFAQGTPPKPASDPATGAGQRSTQNTPMGSTGTPGAGSGAAAQGSTSGSGSASTAGSSGTMSSGSSASSTPSSSGSSDSASSSSTGSGSMASNSSSRSTRTAKADRN
ncbi:hypothetical protein WG902_13995 [Ramlibacter sp. PS3R-8]|uniref:hypothetical protein n=1 Tax=Ramlibacter sp. PS3R-8 TaxID=3133437 RepID=UPI00309A3F82